MIVLAVTFGVVGALAAALALAGLVFLISVGVRSQPPVRTIESLMTTPAPRPAEVILLPVRAEPERPAA